MSRVRRSLLLVAFLAVPLPAAAQLTPEAIIAAAAEAALEVVPPDDPAAPRHTRKQAFGFWTYGLVQMIDISQSMKLFGERKAYEANPVLAPLQDHAELFATVKWSIA